MVFDGDLRGLRGLGWSTETSVCAVRPAGLGSSSVGDRHDDDGTSRLGCRSSNFLSRRAAASSGMANQRDARLVISNKMRMPTIVTGGRTFGSQGLISMNVQYGMIANKNKALACNR